MKKTIVFDGQVFQTAAWDRGMGKYSLCMLEEMAKLWGNHQQIYMIFNSNYPLSDEAQRTLEAMLPTAKRVFLNLHIPEIREHQFDTNDMIEKTRLNKAVLTDFVASLPQNGNDRPEFVILSLFLDEVCAAFPNNTTNTLLCYDLIPLLFAERYSRNENYSYYLARIPMIIEADKILAISQTVADDLSLYLGLSPGKIVNIQGAPIKRDSVKQVRPEMVNNNPFVLMTSGNDMRKNNLNAVRGFEEYVASTGRTDLRLVITSSFDEHARAALEDFSDRLIFTGNIAEGELRWLCEKAKAIMFVPEYEGLGLPILEAVEASKPIVCSSIGAFREMSETAFYYANHQSPSEIAQALGRALSGEEWPRRLGEYPAILKRYTWRKTAKLAFEVLEKNSVPKTVQKKKKLAILGPSPRGYSAIGKVLQQMHPSLSEYFEIDYYFENGITAHEPIRQDYLGYAARVYDANDFNADKYAQYDAVIYHIGNSEYHVNTIKNALYLPGYAIIHDTKLPEIFALANSFGLIADDRFKVEGVLDQMSGVTKTAYLSALVNNQRGVIVHSNYARDAIKEAVSFGRKDEVAIHKLHLPTGIPKIGKTKRSGGLRIGMAGVIHEGKGLRLLEDLTTREEFANMHFSIFGVPVASKEVMNRIEANDSIHIATNLTDREFQDEIAQLDVLINYREEYRGETSLSTIEAMRLGVVPIVRNVGWYGELPDTVAIKLNDSGDISKTLQAILKKEIDIDGLAKRAMSYVASHNSYESYAAKLYEALVEEGQEQSRRIDCLKKGIVDGMLQESF